jgi:hypothetical protein
MGCNGPATIDHLPLTLATDKPSLTTSERVHPPDAMQFLMLGIATRIAATITENWEMAILHKLSRPTPADNQGYFTLHTQNKPQIIKDEEFWELSVERQAQLYKQLRQLKIFKARLLRSSSPAKVRARAVLLSDRRPIHCLFGRKSAVNRQYCARDPPRFGRGEK